MTAMRVTVQTTIGLLLVSALVVQTIKAACKLPEDGDTKTPIPDIFKLSSKSYSFMVEANYKQLGKTLYITEYYDRANMSGKLELEVEGTKTNIVYLAKTNEVFETNSKEPSTCYSSKLSEFDEKKFQGMYVTFDWVNLNTSETIIGPSNIFRKMFLRQRDKGAEMALEAKNRTVRGMKVHTWVWCKGEITVRYSFTDPTQEQPLGLQGIAVPVEITVEGFWENQEIDESFQFVGMQLDIPQRELDLKISIPQTIGCKRLAKNLKPIPDSSRKGMDVNIEMVYTPFTNNNPGFTYTNNFKIAVDLKAEISRVELSSWRKHGDDEMAKPGDRRVIVVDVGNLFVFDMDKSEGTCKVHRLDSDFDRFSLPDGFKINIDDDDIFFLGSDPDSFQYLGETVTRGIPSSVFEKTIEGNLTDMLDKTIITRYHLAEGIQVDNEFKGTNVPMKIILWKIALEENEFTGTLEMNLYDYNSQVPRPHQTFDVSSCFTGNDQSKWFQIVFPLDEYQMKDVLPHIPLLEKDYTTILDKMGEDVPPYRIPKLMVDVDKDNVYMTGLVLERPDFLLDFYRFNDTGLKDLKPVGITTAAGCAKLCLENPICTSFSYCGALCTIADKTIDISTDVVQQADCTLYQSYLGEGESAPTMDEIMRAIGRKVEEGSLVLSLNIPGDKPAVMDLPAALFRDNLAFGLNGLEEKPEGTAEPRFSMYKAGSKMDNNVADEGRSMGRLSFGSCQQGCADKDSCQSFSYCQATMECLMSSKHGTEIPDGNMVASTQCATLSRNYRDYFSEFSGLSLNHEAEKTVDAKSIEGCAKACYEEKSFDCKSFDFCASAPDDKLQPCWLHKEHFTEISETNHIKTDETCGHYSRKYLLDFKQLWHKDMSAAESGAVITNTTADDCSRFCRENQGFYCQGFDFCFDPMTYSSVCTLRKTIPGTLTDKNTCNAYVREGSKVPATLIEEGHSKSATGGLGFLMLLIGLALGIGAIYGYGYWKANKR